MSRWTTRRLVVFNIFAVMVCILTLYATFIHHPLAIPLGWVCLGIGIVAIILWDITRPSRKAKK